MIITHTQTATGQRRLYIGGKASMECWLEPKADGAGWSFHLDEAFTGNRLSDADKRAWATHMLIALAAELEVPPDDLANVPFEAIAALHAGCPFDNRRVPISKRAAIAGGFLATKPGITRPSAEYRSHHREGQRPRG